jgi:sugar phosphate isomerase/epimerase
MFYRHLVFAALMICTAGAARGAERSDAGAEQLGFRLTIQAYTAHHTTVAETLRLVSSVGIKYIEFYEGQTLGGDLPGKFNRDLSAAQLATVNQWLREAGVQVSGCFGSLGADREKNRALFSCAKALGASLIISSPKPDLLLDLAEQAKANGVVIALHNHGKPSLYWDPQMAQKASAPWYPTIGLCADTGHWVRSGIDPVTALAALPNSVISLHWKEMRVDGNNVVDVLYGTGTSNAKGQLAALKQIGFRGFIAIEYEAGKTGDELARDLAAQVRFFDSVTSELAQQP